MNVPRHLADFAGHWTLTREVRDARAGHVVQVNGQAHLHKVDDGLIYDEDVVLRVPGQPDMKGTRRYLWKRSEDAVAVHFDDGRYFHTLKLGVPTAEDHHDCPPDSYHAAYDFSRWPHWKVCWIVSGPRKSYEMCTEYMLR